MIFNDLTPLFREKASREEFYVLREGGKLARVEMEGDLLSQITVTSDCSEQIDNRAYMRILKGYARPITREEYNISRAQKLQLAS